MKASCGQCRQQQTGSSSSKGAATTTGVRGSSSSHNRRRVGLSAVLPCAEAPARHTSWIGPASPIKMGSPKNWQPQTPQEQRSVSEGDSR